MSVPRSALCRDSDGDTWENRSGPDGVSAPLPGPNPASLEQTEERRLMPSLPPAAPGAQQAPIVARMSRLDGCPACVVNTVLPNITRPQEHGFVAHYTCEDCGHDWITSWKD